MSLCPIQGCTDRVSLIFLDDYRDLVQHLWARHGFDIVQCHAIARTVYSPPRQKHKSRKTKVDKAWIEFLKKQLVLPGV